MALRAIIVTVLIFLLAVLGGMLYLDIPRNPMELVADKIVSEPISIIDYGATPVFAENLRFNHNNISYFIDDSCEEARRGDMLEAFDIFENKMRLISFYGIRDKNLSDIKVMCSEEVIDFGESLFAAGEGGPSRIANTTGFKTIEEGQILLYDDSRCEYPIVEVHELGHVFGFDHSPDPKNIMYNTSDCEQRITADMLEIIDELYSIEPLGDALIGNLTAVKRGRYLDFNITVLNNGLIDIEEMTLRIMSGDRNVEDIELRGISLGAGKTLGATNVHLPSLNIEKLDFVLDPENKIREFDENNNFLEVSVSSQ